MSLKYRILPDKRRPILYQALQNAKNLRIMEVHNGLSGLIANTARIESEKGEITEFDGLWVSSLTDSAAKGHPDTEIISFDSRMLTIQEIAAVTNKFIIVDGDTGGEPSQFEYFCAKLENAGVSAVIIEDKVYPKRNSLAADAIQNLDKPKVFAEKIKRGKSVCLSKEFLIFARLESFISGMDLEDALSRAQTYLAAGADGIVIHSNQNSPKQVFEFAEHYQKLFKSPSERKPLICIPTTYSETTDDDLYAHNFNIVIYANYQLRAAHKAMQNACLSILKEHRASPVLSRISSVKEVFMQVGFDEIQKKDVLYQEKKLPLVILAAGSPTEEIQSEFRNTPISNLTILGKKLIDIQVKTLKDRGFTDITLTTGYMADQISTDNITAVYNPEFQITTAAKSLALVKDKIQDGCICIYGDIVFDKALIKHIEHAEGDIVILIDHTRTMVNHQPIKQSVDLVVANKIFATTIRHLNRGLLQINQLGHGTNLKNATHEFIGVIKFSTEGIQLFLNVFEDLSKKQKDIKIDMVDVLEAIVERGYSIQGLEVTNGWLELHSCGDLQAAEHFLS